MNSHQRRKHRRSVARAFRRASIKIVWCAEQFTAALRRLAKTFPAPGQRPQIPAPLYNEARTGIDP